VFENVDARDHGFSIYWVGTKEDTNLAVRSGEDEGAGLEDFQNFLHFGEKAAHNTM
jgi:hypothetical protein